MSILASMSGLTTCGLTDSDPRGLVVVERRRPDALVEGISAVHNTGPVPASAIIAGHGSQPFAFTYVGSAPGSITFNGSASGTDGTDGRTVATSSTASSTVTVQTPSAITAILAIPKSIPLGDTFAAALTVSNSGDASVNLAACTSRQQV